MNLSFACKNKKTLDNQEPNHRFSIPLKLMISKKIIAIALCFPLWASAGPLFEVKSTFNARGAKIAALTLDACGGHFDWELANYLLANNIPATVFVTKGFLTANPKAVLFLKSRPDLFELANHGESHIAPVYGGGKIVGVTKASDLNGVLKEIGEGERAMTQSFGYASPVYRGAAAVYEKDVLERFAQWGRYPAGYSLAVDGGGGFNAIKIAQMFSKIKPGDVILAHIVRPDRRLGGILAQNIEQLRLQGWVFVSFGQASALGMQQWVSPAGFSQP